MTTFDAATIQALGVEDVSDLSRVTPNVSIVQPGATQATFFIRGIGLSDFSSNAAGAVTIFQDDVAINAPAIQTPQLFDIENVDIVRGPQGSGHFRNASAGAIRVRSRRPSRQLLGRSPFHARPLPGRQRAGRAPCPDPGLRGRGRVPDRRAIALLALLVPPARRRPVQDQRLRREASHLATADARRRERLAASPAQAAIVDFINQCGERGRTYIVPSPSPTTSAPSCRAGLPRRVGDAHNWAARGIFRLTPPDSEWDVELNGHGSMLDQQATFGQAIGTDVFVPLPTSQAGGPTFGGNTNSLGNRLYMEPDIIEEYVGLDGRSGLCQDQLGTGSCTEPLCPASAREEPRAQAAARHPPLSRRLRSRGPDDARRLGLAPVRHREARRPRPHRDRLGRWLPAHGRRGSRLHAGRADLRAEQGSGVADLRGGLAVGTARSAPGRLGSRRLLSVRGPQRPGFRSDSRQNLQRPPDLRADDPQRGRLGRLHLGLPRRLHARGRRALELRAEALRLPACVQRQPCRHGAERELVGADGAAHSHLAPQRPDQPLHALHARLEGGALQLDRDR